MCFIQFLEHNDKKSYQKYNLVILFNKWVWSEEFLNLPMVTQWELKSEHASEHIICAFVSVWWDSLVSLQSPTAFMCPRCPSIVSDPYLAVLRAFSLPLDAGVSSLLICPVEPRCLAPHLSGQLLSPSDNQLTSKTHFQLIISFVLVFPQNCVLCSLLAFYEVIYTHYLMKILFFKISDCQVFVFHCLLSNRKW